MIFVPLPLFATLGLSFGLMYLIRTRDMTQVPHRLFAALVALYALQSLLQTLRWGYGIDAVAVWIAALALLLPVLAWMACRSLAGRVPLWPLALTLAGWVVLALARDLADAVIVALYLGFGVAILRSARAERLALVRIAQMVGAARAMAVIGAGLIASAMVDIAVIVDFVRTGGRHVGLAVALVQTGFVLCIGLAAMAGGAGAVPDTPEPEPRPPTETDAAIMARLTALFEQTGLHTDTELNLRRLARKLGLPDRSVSRAVNATQGVSVSQFVNAYRVREACRLLADTDQSVLQVSLAAGFLTKSNFNREFVRVTGQTPSQWRQSRA